MWRGRPQACAPRGVARATPLGAQSAERRLKPPLRALRPPAGCWLSEHAPRALRSQPNRCSERAGHWHARHTGRARPVAVAERAPGRAMARRTKRHPPAQPRQRPRQASGAQSHQPFCKRPTSLIHQKSRFCMLAVRTRRLRHQMLLIALITMMCSDLAYCNALSQYCKSKSGAPWRRGTG